MSIKHSFTKTFCGITSTRWITWDHWVTATWSTIRWTRNGSSIKIKKSYADYMERMECYHRSFWLTRSMICVRSSDRYLEVEYLLKRTLNSLFSEKEKIVPCEVIRISFSVHISQTSQLWMIIYSDLSTNLMRTIHLIWKSMMHYMYITIKSSRSLQNNKAVI